MKHADLRNVFKHTPTSVSNSDPFSPIPSTSSAMKPQGNKDVPDVPKQEAEWHIHMEHSSD
jgi:hypothetical protein